MTESTMTEEQYWDALLEAEQEKYWADRQEQAQAEAERKAMQAAQETEQALADEERYWDRRYAEYAEALAKR